MDYLKKSERLLKHCLKNKRRVTLSLIVAFLITGGLGFTEEKALARDLRARATKNNIRPDDKDPNYRPDMSTAQNGKDVVNIVKPGENGISHNKFIDFNVGTDGVIFNNNATKDPALTDLAGLVEQNTKLQGQAANAILTEVTGNKISTIDGMIEVAGQKADFILANENGITVNGGGFINTSGVTLTTGAVSVDKGNINLDVSKGNISIEGDGVGTSGSYFNVIAQTIKLSGQVAALKGENDTDLNFIAGNNKITKANSSNPDIKVKENGTKIEDDVKYGIYATNLGAMYGNNIRLISTTEGLGVRHEGIIRSKGDISINAKGDIEIAGLNSEKNIEIKGTKDFKTINGTYKAEGDNYYNYSIASKGKTTLEVSGDITIENFISVEGEEGLKITGKNLTIKGDKKTTAGMLVQGALVIDVTGDVNFEALMRPVKNNAKKDDPPLLVTVTKEGKVEVRDPKTQEIVPDTEYTWVATGIQGETIDIKGENLTNKTNISNTRYLAGVSSIKINIKKKLENSGVIYSSGKLKIDTNTLENKKDASIKGGSVEITAETINNAGEMRQNVSSQGENTDRGGQIKINFGKGNFTNTGTVSGYNIEIDGKNFKLENREDGKIIASTADYPDGLGIITITAKDVTNRGTIQSYGGGRKNSITINVETLSNLLGHIVTQKGWLEINNTGNIENTGEIFADDYVTISSTGKNTIRNNGGGATIGSGTNVTIKGENTTVENSGKIAAAQKVLITVSELLNKGDSAGIQKYLEAFYQLGSNGLKEVDDLIANFKKALESETNEANKKVLEQKIADLENVREGLKDYNASLETLPGIGAITARNIEINTGTKTQNNGIIKADSNVTITSEGNLNNTGILEGGKDVTLKADGDIVNSQRIYAGNKLEITGKSFTSTGSTESLNKYAEILQQFSQKGGDKKLDELETQIQDLLKKIKSENNSENISKLKEELTKITKEKEEISKLKAQISTIRETQVDGKDGTGLGTIESKDISITTTNGKLENAGIIVTTGKLDLNAQGNEGDIKNTGNIAVGTTANITGKSFISEVMTVGQELVAKVQNAFESKSLQVGTDMKLTAGSAKFTKDLDVGKDADITITGTDAESNVTFGGAETKESETEKGAAVNVTGNLTIKGGGLINKTDTAIKGNLNIDKDRVIEGTTTKEETTTTNTNAKFENSGTLAVKGGATIDTNSFSNTKNIVTEGKLDVTSTTFNNEKDGVINTSGFGLNASDAITNAGKIETKGNLDITGKKSLTNSGSILVEGIGKINVTDSVTNSGEIKAGKTKTENAVQEEEGAKNGDLSITTGEFTNKESGKVSGESKLTIKVNKSFKNEGNNEKENSKGGEITGGEIYIDGTSEKLDQNFDNYGTISSVGKLTINLGENKKNIYLGQSGKMTSGDTMTLITGGNIYNEGKFSNIGGLDFKAGKEITNKGMIVSKGKIDLTANGNITNGEQGGTGSTIWSEDAINIKSETGNIYNYQHSTIQSKKDMSLTAEKGTLLNEGGKISAGGKLNINVKRLENKSIISKDDIKITTGGTYYYGTAYNDNNSVKINIEITMPKITFDGKNSVVSTIEAGNDITVKTTEGVLNQSAKIRGNGSINFEGNGTVKNETIEQQISIEDYLKYVQIKIEQVNTGSIGKPGKQFIVFEGNFWNGIKDNSILTNGNIRRVFERMAGLTVGNNKPYDYKEFKDFYEFLDKSTSGKLLGSGKRNVTINDIKTDTKKSFYPANTNAEIIAKNNIKINGKVENGEGFKNNTSVTVDIGDQKVETVDTNLGVTIQNPNEITSANGITYPDGVEVITGKVTINGVTIDATTGGTVTSIAVAGTINPIIYIDKPIGDNGIFKPAAPRPGEKVQYKYETNIDFIDLSKYYGSEYFFNKIGYNPDKPSTVIGDAYYEKELINKTIKDSLGYTGEITSDNIKNMLDNASDVQKDLGLVVGKPLTPEQINNLEKDIVWYVEVDMDGEKVLVPQVYFGKETRLKIAEGDKGGGAGSTIKAGGNIDIKGDSVTNVNGNITAGGNVNIDVTGDVVNNATGGFQGGISSGGDTTIKAGGNIDMIGGTVKSDGNASLDAGGNTTIESTLGGLQNNQTVSNEAGVSAKGDVTISSGGDTTIVNGVVESTDKGDVTISGDTVNIKDQNIISSSSSSSDNGVTKSKTETISSKSDGSTIAGENVTIKSNKDTNIKGSDVVAGNTTNIEAGGDVNITDGQDYSHTTSKSSTTGFINGKLTIGDSSSEVSTSTSKKSTVGGVGGTNITSKGGDVNIKGSDVIGGDKGVNISAKDSVNITDGQNTVKTKSDSWQYDVISFTKGSSESKTTTSQGSNITSTGGINISAGGDVKSVGSNIASTKDTTINAGGDVKFEAGKNTHEEKSNSIGVGIISAGANVGAGGASAGANWDINQGGSVSVVDGKASDQTINDMNKVGKSGKNYMDSLTNAQATVGISVNNSTKNSTTWTEGKVQTGGDLNIKSGGTTDIGGADFTTGNDFNITAKDIDSTKYTDVNEETSNGFSVGVKVGNMTTSSIADTVNKGMQIAENAQAGQVNEGLTAAQVAGSVSNVIFGDLAANTSSVTGEFALNNSKSKTTSENTTNIKSGGDINFKATEGDINLKGVEMEGNDISLDAKKDVNISSSQNTSDEHGFGVTASGGITASAGVGAIDGANAQVGFTGNAGFNKTDNSSVTNSGSSIKGNNITIKSGGDTNVKGSTVEGNDVSLDVGGNLNVETEKDKVDESRIDAWAGGDLSGGVASNTIATGDIGLSAGGGQIYKKGDSISQQAGITAKNKIDVNVGKDVNLKGGVIGSETGDGSLTVGGNINVDDVHSDLNGGGAIVGANGGTKGGGILGEVGDVIDKEQTAKGTIGIGKDNITVGGDVTVNGKTNSNDNRDNGPNLDGINTDMSNGVTIDKDVVKGGGTFSGTVSALPSKKGSKKNADSDAVDGPIIPKVSDGDTPSKGNVSNKVPDLDLPDTPPKVELPKPSFPESGKVVVDGPSAPVQKSEVTDLPKPQVPDTVAPKAPETGKVVVDGPSAPVQKSEVTDVPKPNTGTAETVPPKTPVEGGYVKDPDTGKWVPADGGNGGLPGAKTTNGPFGSKESVDGFQKGIKGETNVVTPPKQAPVTEGNYVKDPSTGKWVPADGGNGGLPGAKTTNGPFGSKESVDGFQKGIKGETNVVTPPKQAPVTEGNYVKDPSTGKWVPANGNNGGTTNKGGNDNGSFETPNITKPTTGTANKVTNGGDDNGSFETPNITKPTTGTANKVTNGGSDTGSATKGNTGNDTPTNNNGYTKDPTTGKWVPADGNNGGLPGAKTTNGPFGSKESVDGFQKGIKGETNVVTPPKQGPVTEGNYVKDPTTGKWVPANGNNGGTTNKGGNDNGSFETPNITKPTTGTANKVTNGGDDNGSFETPNITKPTTGTANKVTNGGSDTGSATKGNTGNDTPASNNGYVKDSTTGKWVATGGDKGPQGAITTNGPFGSKGSLEGFQKGAASLNKGGNDNGGFETPNITKPNTGTAKKVVVDGGSDEFVTPNITKPNTGTAKKVVVDGGSDEFVTPNITKPTTGTAKKVVNDGGDGTTTNNGDNTTTTNNGYVKDPTTGKWVFVGNTGSQQGAITTNGPFGSKGSLDGFQKGVASLNKGNNGVTTSKGSDEFVTPNITKPTTGTAKKVVVDGGSDEFVTPNITKPTTGTAKKVVVDGGSDEFVTPNITKPTTGTAKKVVVDGGSDEFVTPNITKPTTGTAKKVIVDGGSDEFVTPNITKPTTGTAKKVTVDNGNGNTTNEPVTNGGYVKDPTTGKWTPVGGDKGPQGAITTNGPFSTKQAVDGFQKGAASLNKGNGEVKSTKKNVDTSTSNDKYAVLDKDNAFDFPQDDGVRVSINDTANESKIVPEHYEPLNSEPPAKGVGNTTAKKMDSDTEKKLGDLLQEQFDIANKPKLSSKDKERLEQIENELRGILESQRPSLPPVDYDVVDGNDTIPPAPDFPAPKLPSTGNVVTGEGNGAIPPAPPLPTGDALAKLQGKNTGTTGGNLSDAIANAASKKGNNGSVNVGGTTTKKTEKPNKGLDDFQKELADVLNKRKNGTTDSSSSTSGDVTVSKPVKDEAPSLPPVDYETGDSRPALPPVDYNDSVDGGLKLPGGDIVTGEGNGAIPPAPPLPTGDALAKLQGKNTGATGGNLSDAIANAASKKGNNGSVNVGGTTTKKTEKPNKGLDDFQKELADVLNKRKNGATNSSSSTSGDVTVSKPVKDEAPSLPPVDYNDSVDGGLKLPGGDIVTGEGNGAIPPAPPLPTGDALAKLQGKNVGTSTNNTTSKKVDNGSVNVGTSTTKKTDKVSKSLDELQKELAAFLNKKKNGQTSEGASSSSGDITIKKPQEDKAPALPPVDYKSKKSVSFDDKVDVKYIDDNSTTPVEGGQEIINDKK